VLHHILLMCRDDASSSVRRSAVEFIAQLRQSTDDALPLDCFQTLAELVVRDVDSDVKCCAVMFWRHCLLGPTTRPTCCQSALVTVGLGCLLAAAVDCDRAVRLEAIRTLGGDVGALVDGPRDHPARKDHPALKDHSEVEDHRALEDQPTVEDHPAPKDHSEAGPCCLRICSDPHLTKSQLTLLSSAAEEFRTVTRRDFSEPGDEDVPGWSRDVDTEVDGAPSGLLSMVMCTDWKRLLTLESDRSSDCHSNNAISLLDDILVTAQWQSGDASWCQNDNMHEALAVDCY